MKLSNGHRGSPFAGPRRIALAALAMLCLAPRLPAQLPNVLPEPAEGLEVIDRRGEQIPPEIVLTTSGGRRVTLGQYFDGERPVLLVMMYLSCPVVCPTVLDQTKRTLNDLDFTTGDEFRTLVVSFDSNDTPEALAREKSMFLLGYDHPQDESVRDGLTFLASEPSEARRLAEALGFDYKFLPASGQYSHATGIFLITPNGRVSRFIGGLEYPANDVRLGLLEAGEGKIGDVFDKFTLWCFHFDPTENSYTLQAFRVMQVGAVLTAVLLGGLVLGLVLWERRKRSRAAAASRTETVDHIGNATHAVGHA